MKDIWKTIPSDIIPEILSYDFTMKIIWKKIPSDIVVKILSYDKRIKYRNGVFMNQILQTDKRYKLCKSIPEKITHIYWNSSKTVIEHFFIFVHFSNGFSMQVSDREENCIKYDFFTAYNNWSRKLYQYYLFDQ